MMSPARLRLIALLAALAAALQSGCGGKSSAPGAVAPSAFSYAASPATYTKGVAISPSLPHSSGGAAASYTISPQLPAGLTFDATSGVIAGTPTVLRPLTAYTVTAINAGGTASCSLLIAVNDVAPAALSYFHNAVTYTPGVGTSRVRLSPDGGCVSRGRDLHPRPPPPTALRPRGERRTPPRGHDRAALLARRRPVAGGGRAGGGGSRHLFQMGREHV